MNKKIVIITSSPRKGGNSDLLCDEFQKGALESDNTVVRIDLRDYKIDHCHACYACFKTGQCFMQDGMEQILDKIIDADVVVLATPVYFVTMSSQLKTMIDRTMPRYAEFSGKDMYIILTAHDGKVGMKLAADELTGIGTTLGNHVKQVIYGSGVWQKGEVIGTQAMDEAYTAGRES